MFERELVDTLFIERWGIVRTAQRQSIAEHMYLVTHYVNDLCVYFELPETIHLACLQKALWHDVDEIFSGDMPGPNKRMLMDDDARSKWDKRLWVWMNRVFDNLLSRSGGAHEPDNALIIKLVIKTADWLEASVRMATEFQMGNACCRNHIESNKISAIATAKQLCEAVTGMKVRPDIPFEKNEAEIYFWPLSHAIEMVVGNAAYGQSRGPMITGEDASKIGGNLELRSHLQNDPKPHPGEPGDYA